MGHGLTGTEKDDGVLYHRVQAVRFSFPEYRLPPPYDRFPPPYSLSLAIYRIIPLQTPR
jgi:hypothetical protein